MLATLWANVEAAIPLIAIIGAGIIVYATKGIPKARIEGLEGSVETLKGNNAALHDQIVIQQEKFEESRQQDKAECDRRIDAMEAQSNKRIDELQAQIAHALSEASAARSDVMTAVSEAATAAVRAENQEAMAKASALLAVGQKQIIDGQTQMKDAILDKLDVLIERKP